MANTDARCDLMSQAFQLARQGQGKVEPNPLVGCVIVRDGKVVGQGFHGQFGGPHAEVEALSTAGDAASGATAYVTLEPCCHQGKTGPCTEALIQAGVARVVVGCEDPNTQVAGQGIAALRAAGIDVGLMENCDEAIRLIAPFSKLMITGRPWVIAKWAMTLDGKIASHTGSSQWISGEASRAVVHQLRGRVDAILVGRGTADADNPLLTARPPGPRTATRIVLDSQALLSSDCKLIQSLGEAPLLVAMTSNASPRNRKRLADHGAEVFTLSGDTRAEQLASLLDELGRRQMTNLLVEGGGEVFGTLLDLRQIDEVHAFIAPKLVGGATAPGPVAGLGIAEMSTALHLESMQVEMLDADLHVHGYLISAPH